MGFSDCSRQWCRNPDPEEIPWLVDLIAEKKNNYEREAVCQ